MTLLRRAWAEVRRALSWLCADGVDSEGDYDYNADRWRDYENPADYGEPHDIDEGWLDD